MLVAPASVGKGTGRRRLVTFIGFLLVISMVVGVSCYVDCISADHWNELLNVGSVAMMVQGDGIENRVADIEAIQGISAAATLAGAECNLRMDQDEIYVNDPLAPNFLVSGISYSLSQDYKQDFRDEFALTEGRWPETETEIAITPSVADQANVGIGAQMNYSIELNVGKRPVYVVGIYRQLMSSSFDYYYNSIAVVLLELLHPEETEFRVSVDVSREILNPWNPQETLRRLVDIERSITALYPGYPEEVLYSGYHVTDDLAIGVNEYIEWIGQARTGQLFRSQGVLILGGLFSILLLQHSFEAREFDLWMHHARGASREKENRKAIGEIAVISLLAAIPALLIGYFILARLAYAAVGFFTVDISRYLEAPILFTLDTLLFSILIAVFAPLSTYSLMTSLQTSKKETEIIKGRLARIAKFVRVVRWDVTLLAIGALLLLALGLGGISVQDNPVLRIVLSFLPAVFFIAVASLALKALSRFPDSLSDALERYKAFQSKKLGIRRLGRGTKSTAFVILLFSATLTLTISSSAVAYSMPITQLNHARFAIGADITFHLSSSRDSLWSDFIADAAENEHVEALAEVSVGRMYLSEGRQGGVQFVAAAPSDFVDVGYDENGNRLSESRVGQVLMELDSSRLGAIITEDIASEYDLRQGDLLRSFSLGEEDDTMEFEILAVLPVLPAPLIPSSTSLDNSDIVGRTRVWLNIDHVSAGINLVDSTDNYLCIGIGVGANSTLVGEEILSDWENDILHLGEWAAVDHELDTYLDREGFKLDRAVDTIVSATSYIFVFAALIIQVATLGKTQERERALQRSMGASELDLVRLSLAEALAFVVFGLLLVGLLSPLLVGNYLEIALGTYPSWSFGFYIRVFPVIPWILIIALSILVSFLTFASYGASVYAWHRKCLAETLSANWTKYPYVEVMA